MGVATYVRPSGLQHVEHAQWGPELHLENSWSKSVLGLMQIRSALRTGSSVVTDETKVANQLTMQNAHMHMDDIGQQLIPSMQAPAASQAMAEPPTVKLRGGGRKGVSQASGGSKGGNSGAGSRGVPKPAPAPPVPEHHKKRDALMKDMMAAISSAATISLEPECPII